MNKPLEYTPPLGSASTAKYDDTIRRWTRERVWRQAMLDLLAPVANEDILDVGSGTGSFALLVKLRQPRANVQGIDPDGEARGIAVEKARSAGLDIAFAKGFARDTRPNSADAVTSSLVLHQMPLAEKERSLAAMFRALRPGGRFVLADYGRQDRLMRILFRLTVQRLDGVSDTQPNADGILPSLLSAAGFAAVTEHLRVPTITGSIALFTAKKTMSKGL